MMKTPHLRGDRRAPDNSTIIAVATYEDGTTAYLKHRERNAAEPEVVVVAATAMDERVQEAACRALKPISETIIVTVKAGR
jgi:hypothetical protein